MERKLTVQDIRLLMSSISEGTSKFDVEGRYIYVSRQYAKALGYTPEELIGRPWTDTVHPSEYERLAPLYEKMLQRGKVVMQSLGLRNDGSTFPKEATMIARYDDDGSFAGGYCIARDISDKIELEESRERFVQVYRKTPAILHSIDHQERIVNVSDRWLETFGYEREEVLGKRSMEFLTEQSREKAQSIIPDFLSGKRRTGTFHYQFKKKNGQIVDVELAVSAEKDPNGKVAYLHAVLRDLSAEIALQEAEKRYHDLYNKTPIMLHSIDAQGHLISVSDMWLEKMGYTREEVLGRKSLEFLTPASQKIAKGVLQRFIRDGFLERIDYQMVKKDGSLMDVALSATAEMTPEGTVKRSLALIHDMTEFHKEGRIIDTFYNIGIDDSIPLEERIGHILKMGSEHLDLECGIVSRITGDRYEVIYFNCLNDEMYVAPGTIFDLRETYCERAYNSGEVIAYHNSSVDGLSKLPCYEKFHLNSYVGAPVYVNGQLFGTVSFSGRAARDKAFSDREKTFSQFMAQWVGGEISRDQYVQQLKTSQKQLSEVVDQLKASNEELENFAYICSHDLQEPLRMVSAFSSRLETLLGHPESQDERMGHYLERIQSGSRAAQELVTDLLSYARVARDPSVQRMEKVDLNKLVGDIVATQEDFILAQDIAVSIEDLPILNGNKTQIFQVFQNLISNALKFSNQKSPHVKVGSSQNAKGEWVFTVTDNGIGIDPRYHAKVFEIFQRLNKKDYAGTGIGLAICKRVVQEYEGKIWCQSSLGKGTTFLFTLPKAQVIVAPEKKTLQEVVS